MAHPILDIPNEPVLLLSGNRPWSVDADVILIVLDEERTTSLVDWARLCERIGRERGDFVRMTLNLDSFIRVSEILEEMDPDVQRVLEGGWIDGRSLMLHGAPFQNKLRGYVETAGGKLVGDEQQFRLERADLHGGSVDHRLVRQQIIAHAFLTVASEEAIEERAEWLARKVPRAMLDLVRGGVHVPHAPRPRTMRRLPPAVTTALLQHQDQAVRSEAITSLRSPEARRRTVR